VSATLEERTVTLAPKEVAVRLGVKESTLANWRWSGRGPRHVRVGGRIRYRAQDLVDYLDSQTRTSTSDPGPDA